MVGVETCDVPDLENATRSGTGSTTYGTNARQTEYIAMVNNGNDCQLQGYMFHGKLAIAVCCAEVLFQPSFLGVQ